MKISDILQLSVAERIRLVQEIWDSVSTVPDAIPLTEAQSKELDQRIAHAEANPDDRIPWEKIKAEFLGHE